MKTYTAVTSTAANSLEFVIEKGYYRLQQFLLSEKLLNGIQEIVSTTGNSPNANQLARPTAHSKKNAYYDHAIIPAGFTDLQILPNDVDVVF